MADLSKIEDEALRARLQEANQHLRKGKAADAVRTLADVFLSMLTPTDGAPSPQGVTVAGRRGRRAPLAMGWPNLGANLVPESLRQGKPEIVFTRERFAMSEAMTYYEFTVDAALTLQQRAAAIAAGEIDDTNSEEQNQ